MYMGKDLIEDGLFNIIHQSNERKVTSVNFLSLFVKEIHPFYNGNGITCKILFANNNEIIKLIIKQKKLN